jgi:hypothetical protein
VNAAALLALLAMLGIAVTSSCAIAQSALAERQLHLPSDDNYIAPSLMA